MGLSYENLDGETRRFMLEEIEIDVANNTVYLSSYLNAQGCEAWPQLLREAAERGNDDSLAAAIRSDRCLKDRVERRKPKGGTTIVAVPYTAHETLGEGQFNMYYTRGLCRRAIEAGVSEIEVYRAKAVAEPRPESQRLIGTRLDPRRVLDDLRSTKGVESALGLARPNSGLTLRILS